MSGKSVSKRQSSANPGAHAARSPVMLAASLAFRWYDEIAAGRKRTEYREICGYWDRLIWERRERITSIKFTRGYTRAHMIWEVRRIDRDENEGIYKIRLGKRID